MNKLLNLIIMTECINSNGEENFIVLDGGLGTELTRAGLKIDVRWCKIPIFFYEMTINKEDLSLKVIGVKNLGAFRRENKCICQLIRRLFFLRMIHFGVPELLLKIQRQ